MTGNLIFAQNTEEEKKEEEELPVYAGEEIVVTESKEKVPTVSTIATKVPVPIRLTPASIGVVNHGLFQHQSGVVLGDALRNVSGVNIQTVFGVTDFFVIRGFDSLSSGLVLTDGASGAGSHVLQSLQSGARGGAQGTGRVFYTAAIRFLDR